MEVSGKICITALIVVFVLAKYIGVDVKDKDETSTKIMLLTAFFALVVCIVSALVWIWS